MLERSGVSRIHSGWCQAPSFDAQLSRLTERLAAALLSAHQKSTRFFMRARKFTAIFYTLPPDQLANHEYDQEQ